MPQVPVQYVTPTAAYSRWKYLENSSRKRFCCDGNASCNSGDMLYFHGAKFRDLRGRAGNRGDNSRRMEMPFREQAIGFEAAMQRTGGDTVKIVEIFARDGAEAVEIEVRVANFKRIESPADQANVAADGFFALKKFQHAAHATIAIVGCTPVICE